MGTLLFIIFMFPSVEKTLRIIIFTFGSIGKTLDIVTETLKSVFFTVQSVRFTLGSVVFTVGSVIATLLTVIPSFRSVMITLYISAQVGLFVFPRVFCFRFFEEYHHLVCSGRQPRNFVFVLFHRTVNFERSHHHINSNSCIRFSVCFRPTR